MAKRIVLLSDGTGNAAGKVWRTNVWRLFGSLELKSSGQIAIYDDGVGSSSFKPLAILGGVFGWGLKRNVIELYKFLCRNHMSRAQNAASGFGLEDDKIYAFGFSRGAFTIRVLIGLVLNQGLVGFADEKELDSKARAAYRAYRHEKYSVWNLQYPFRLICVLIDKFIRRYKPNERPIKEIEFVGVWDTVAAYGLPIDEMTRGVNNWIWPLELPNREFNGGIKRARHALSIDDERQTFHPVLWDENALNTKPAGKTRSTEHERLLQVWFAGVHSNVGGGYPDDSLANVSLAWMLAEAEAAGLKFKKFPGAAPDVLISTDSAQDKDGRLYDSRNGLGGYYRYSPRKIEDFYQAMPKDAKDAAFTPVPKIHESVFGRIRIGAHGYAPIGLPKDYEVLKSGTITVDPDTFTINPISLTVNPNVAKIAEGAASNFRHERQESVWNQVWRRRALYFLTVFASVHLVLYPLYRDSYVFEELRTRLRIVSDAIRLIGGVLPGLASRWLDAYARDPAWFLVSAALVAFLLWISARLGGSITDRMRQIFTLSLPGTRISPKAPAKTSPLWLIPKALFIAILLYLACYPLFDRPWLTWLRLPGSQSAPDALRAHNIVTAYTAWPVWFIIATFLIVYFVPEFLVQKLRKCWLYQAVLRGFKYRLAPALSAIGILFFAVTLGNHYLFNIRDSFGDFCTPVKINNESLTLKNHGFSHSETTEKWTKTITIDTSPNAKNDLCIPLEVFVKTGDRYRVVVNRKPYDKNDFKVGRWTFWDEGSFMGGQPVSSLPTEKAIAMALLFPLRRTFDRPWGSVILRVGSTGSEEDFLDPNPPEQKDLLVADRNKYAIRDEEQLSEIFKPKRDGELYVYLNKPVLGWWGLESWISRNWIGNTGKAEIFIEALD